MLELRRGNLALVFRPEIGAAELSDLALGVSFRQCSAPDAKISDAREADGKIAFSAHCQGVRLSCAYGIDADETGSFIFLDISSDAEFEDSVCYPPPFSVSAGDREIDAYCEGISFFVEEDIPIPQKRPLYGGSWNSMSFWGLSHPDGGWLLSAVMTNFDAALITQKNKDALYTTQIAWEPQKGRWGYCRRMRFYLGKGSPVTDICLTYRKIAERKGLVRTLREKAEQTPAVDRLAGSANVWLWNNDAMDKLYSDRAVYSPPSKEQFALRREIARDMKARGMDNVLWSIFDENIDRETVVYIKSLGYLTSYYDVYTDVIPAPIADKIPETRRRRCAHRMPFWPEGITVQKDGSLCPAWELKGTDGKFYPQNRLCDIAAVDCAREYVAAHGVKNGIEGVFIDVAVCGAYECYSEKHPMTREDAFTYKNRLLALMGEMGLVCGTENGHEDAVRSCDYSEGMMSPPLYRPHDSGRRMTHLYDGDQIEPKIRTSYMLSPKHRVPLWELVYHDCQTSYWYWGDSSNCCPPLMPLRDLFNALYGLPPLYSFKADDWPRLREEISASYQRTVPLAKKLRYARMIAFDYITGDMTVQRTAFDDGTEIVANFRDEDYEYRGNTIAPLGAWMTG